LLFAAFAVKIYHNITHSTNYAAKANKRGQLMQKPHSFLFLALALHFHPVRRARWPPPTPMYRRPLGRGRHRKMERDTVFLKGANGYFPPQRTHHRAEVRGHHRAPDAGYQTASANTFSDVADDGYSDPILKANYSGVLAGLRQPSAAPATGSPAGARGHAWGGPSA
jgi:hypothetical protein